MFSIEATTIRLLVVALAFAWLILTPNAVARTLDCAAAAAIAEAEHDLPRGLLASIGRVESGDRPFAIDADGRSSLPTAAGDAVRQVQYALAEGARYVDVGCFQVDLFWHAGLFARLSDAFDPLANARAAATVLDAFRRQTATLQDAIARYHSGQAIAGGAYATRVVDQWRGGTPTARVRPIAWFGIGVVTPGSAAMRSAGLPRVLVP